ncbi:MAG: molybdopterin-dependent oxidoreductase, partial [Candidatus Aminicenantales bacterium]
PHLCYYPAFPPEGSCRLCLVEIEGHPKLELSCSTKVREGMKIQTKSQRVMEARQGVLEFLLSEHPLDCPLCDKAGDCKLQDYYEEYGLFDSQFYEYKEKRDKKVKIGKNLILDRERCILCTRCVRFLREVTKTQELGVFNRGIKSEIDIYNGFLINNNYSGNLAEICPVGAITDLDFRFKTRSWFLEKGDSICPLCSRGCNIQIEYHRGLGRFTLPQRVYRVKARQNMEVNSYWICDRGRYGYSYLDEKRAFNPIGKNGGQNQEILWDEALDQLTAKLKKLYFMKKTSQVALVLNSWLSNEELFLAKKIFKEDLKVASIFFADPPDQEGDDFLLTSERSPNKRGAKEIGWAYVPFTMEALADNKINCLLIFGNFLENLLSPAQLKSGSESIKTKFLFSSHRPELELAFDVMFPTAVIAEKGGSLTNTEGIVQKFRPALPVLGESRPEWKILIELARRLDINFAFYRRLSSPELIYREMAKEIPYFRKEK